MLNNTAYVNLTKSQALMHAYNCNKMYATLARNSGKTSACIGLRVYNLSQVMSGAQVLLYTDTFERHNDVIVPGILSFLEQHAGMIEGDDFSRQRPVDDPGDLLHDLQEFAARLVDQAGVGRYSVEQPSFGKRADLRDFGSVGEEFHEICVRPVFVGWAKR